MRNTTKLKHLLLKYTACFDMNDEGVFVLSLIDKYSSMETKQFEGKSYAIVVAKGYQYMLRELKENSRIKFED